MRQPLKFFGLVSFSVSLVFSISSFAQVGISKGPSCWVLFEADTKIRVNAMQEADRGAQLLSDAQRVAKIARSLGLSVPAHQLNLTPQRELNTLAVMGGPAAPHWVDGQTLVNGLQGAMGVLEFVTPGCPTCRSFYAASTPPDEQLSILYHVAGHNDYATTSRFEAGRAQDGPLAGYQLAKTMQSIYRSVDPVQVKIYYQLLQSLTGLQDLMFGTFEAPESFKPGAWRSPTRPANKPNFWEPAKSDGRSLADDARDVPRDANGRPVAWRQTRSILQALTQYLPAEAEQWQKDVFNLFEQRSRPFPGVVMTKIANEGWAVMQQYLIAKHDPNVSSKTLVRFAQLMSGVAGNPKKVRFDNPYSLGSSGWLNLYDQFQDRPEVKALKTPLEKDRAFVHYARSLYANRDDVQMAKIMFDERWVQRNKLYLYRKMDWSEYDHNHPMEQQGFLVLSRDWRRIQNYIITRFVNLKHMLHPDVVLKNPDVTPGFIRFSQESREYGFSMGWASSAKTLFVIAKLTGRNAQLDANFDHFGVDRGVHGEITVSPDGKVRFEWKEKVDVQKQVQGYSRLFNQPPPTTDELEVQKGLQEAVDSYIADVSLSMRPTDLDLRTHQNLQILGKASDRVLSGMQTLVGFAPTTGEAIMHYGQEIEDRLMHRLQGYINGSVSGKLGPNGLSLPVLPEVPTFTYSRRSLMRFERQAKPGKVDGARLNLTIAAADGTNPGGFDDAFTGGIGRGPHLPGDKMPGPRDGQGDDGDGGKGDPGTPGDPVDPSQQPGEGKGAGSGGGGKKDVTIPVELLGEMLDQYMALPNLRRTDGQTEAINFVRRGGVRKPSGHEILDRTVMQAMQKAMALRKSKGLPFQPPAVSPETLIQEALKLIGPEDKIVSGKMEKPLPDIEAVLTVKIDATASMWGERIQNAQLLAWNLKAFLKTKYKAVHIRWILFDTEAEEVPEDRVTKTFKGGGTNYESGALLEEKILAEYPNERFNKYSLTIGDGETMDGEQMRQTMSRYMRDLQYAAFAITNENSPWTAEFLKSVEALKSEFKWVGAAYVESRQRVIPALIELFPKDGKIGAGLE